MGMGFKFQYNPDLSNLSQICSHLNQKCFETNRAGSFKRVKPCSSFRHTTTYLGVMEGKRWVFQPIRLFFGTRTFQ